MRNRRHPFFRTTCSYLLFWEGGLPVFLVLLCSLTSNFLTVALICSCFPIFHCNNPHRKIWKHTIQTNKVYFGIGLPFFGCGTWKGAIICHRYNSVIFPFTRRWKIKCEMVVKSYALSSVLVTSLVEAVLYFSIKLLYTEKLLHNYIAVTKVLTELHL